MTQWTFYLSFLVDDCSVENHQNLKVQISDRYYERLCNRLICIQEATLDLNRLQRMYFEVLKIYKFNIIKGFRILTPTS